ncbi:pectin lyase fold/virulence factor [Elsinoe ampelina]|uniref:Pectin lyase fold/virulence factor n=1 Tax=Elsinoe ampelina TaxID=302913 RepID=A0A6A6G4X8_9PEZI|nr:pectin lyase fold/virulence factor [Elsinoe ampelina]
MIFSRLTTLTTLVACFAAVTQASPVSSLERRADTSCTAAADGFASLNGGTTGGAGGIVVIVTTQADLVKFAKASGKHVIKVKGRISITPKGTEVEVTNDKTIIGIGASGEIYQGGFKLNGAENVIFRNLKIGNTYVEGDEEGKTQDWDGIQMDTASNVWIDHVLFEKGGDGLIDSRKDTNFLTVSNSVLQNHNKAFGIGWTENYAHLYNNYVVGAKSYGHYARGKTDMRMENVYFENSKNPITADSTAKLAISGNVYKSTTGTTAKDQGTVFNASSFYKYTLTPSNNVPSVVKAESGPKASICTS